MKEQRIRLLSESTINQIAAGEVIENPSSVVKELIENALDAGATEITLETQAGGRGSIVVSDNGSGMGEADVLLCVERHATSKLINPEELESIETLGFRGEALPSIASVSKMSIHTANSSKGGLKLSVEGGKLGELLPLPRTQGTQIEVRSLFFNAPVRRRFQKSIAADTTEVHKIFTRFALGYPKVGFLWVNDGKTQIEAKRGEELGERVSRVLGGEFASKLLPVEHQVDEMRCEGVIGSPLTHRPNRTGQYLFINGRMVESLLISKSLLEGYGTRLPPNRFPVFVLFLDLPKGWVDVNVHPQKKHVRLREEGRLSSFLARAVQRALESQEYQEAPRPIQPSFSEFTEIPDWSRQWRGDLEELKPESASQVSLEACEPSFTFNAPRSERKQEKQLQLAIKPTLLTQVGRFLVLESREGVRVIDGKRALERIIYAELSHPKEVQSLLLPIQLTFSGEEKRGLEEKLGEIRKLGIGIRPFGGETFVVDAIPSLIKPDEVEDLIHVYLEEGNIPKKIGTCLKRTQITRELAELIIERLHTIPESAYTPAGKRIEILLDEAEMEKVLK